MQKENENSAQVKALLKKMPLGAEILDTLEYHKEHYAEQLWYIASCLQQSEDFTESLELEKVNLTLFLGDINRLLTIFTEAVE